MSIKSGKIRVKPHRSLEERLIGKAVHTGQLLKAMSLAATVHCAWHVTHSAIPASSPERWLLACCAFCQRRE